MRQNNLFEILKKNSWLQKHLTYNNIFRVFEFGEAPQNIIAPYVVWQLKMGEPEEQLNGLDEWESQLVQIDVYADSSTMAKAIVRKVREALENKAQLLRYNLANREEDTRMYRISIDIEFTLTKGE